MISDNSLFRAKNANQFESPDLTSQNIDKIAALFPNCVTEMRDENGKLKRAVNFEMLKQMLSPDVVDGDECYEFTWVGKKAAVVEANKPIRKTLRAVFRDSSFADSPSKINVFEIFKLYMPEDANDISKRVRVI